MHETAALTAVQQEMSQCVCPQQTRNASLLGCLGSVLTWLTAWSQEQPSRLPERAGASHKTWQ